jgi:hypothetical protein
VETIVAATERRFLAIAAVTALTVTCLPYLWAALTAPVGARFGWGVGFLPDTLGNLIFVRQAASGSLLFANTYTAEPHPARFFHPLFLLVGWAQAVTRLAPGLLLQFVRLGGAALFLLGVVAAGRRFYGDPAGRRALVCLLLTGGGLGFLAPVIPAVTGSADIMGAEMTTFFSLYEQPHFILALALLLWAVLHFLDAIETGSPRSVGLAALCHLLLAAVHPYDIPVTTLAAVATAVLARRRPFPWTPLLVFVAAPVPLLAYDAWLAAFVPVYRDFAAEGLLAAPWPVRDYCLGFALLLPLALAGVAGALRARDSRWLLPGAWLLAAPVLMCLPLPARRKFMEGYHLMLCLLAAHGWTLVAPRLGRWRLPVAVTGLILMSLSQAYVLARDVYAIDLSRRAERAAIRIEAGDLLFPLGRPTDRIFAPDPWMGGILSRDVDRYDVALDLARVLAWAAAHLDRSAVILAAPSTGLLVPMYTPHRVVAGHLFETLRLEDKTVGIRAVMDRYLPEDGRRFLLGRLGATAILVDDRLLALGEWRPDGTPWIATLASEGRVRLWAVAPEPDWPPLPRLAAETQVAACLLALSGRDLLDRGRFEDAISRLRQALEARPYDPRIPGWLRAAEAGRSGRPAPRGTRNSG